MMMMIRMTRVVRNILKWEIDAEANKNNLKKIEGVTCRMMTSEFSIASSSSV